MKLTRVISQSQMEWACRRGMLECDLFLLPFVKKDFKNLSEVEQSDLYDLLQCPDPQLYEWLMGKSCPVGLEAHLGPLIERIRLLRPG